MMSRTGRREDNARRPTVTDVGALAGVSVATVSRALNGVESVDPVLRARVIDAARELGYRPDGLARGLRRKVTTVFGMLIPDIENPFFTSMVRGAEDAAQRGDHLLMLCNTDENVDKEKAYLEGLLDQRIAGLLLAVADEEHSDVSRFIEWGTPVVAVDRRCHGNPIDAVLVDNVAGSRQAIEWLIRHNYSRIATIAGPERTTTGLERLLGYQQALVAAGIPLQNDLVVHGDFHVDEGHRAASVLLDDVRPLPEAIFVANNQMTIGAIAAITERGLDVPGDVAVACFDRLPSGLSWCDSIVTIEQPAYDMGRVAVEMLLRRIAGDDFPVSEVRLQPELHEPLRTASTSAVRSRTRRQTAAT